MYGWMDGWIDVCMDGWMDGWLDGWMDGWKQTILRSANHPTIIRAVISATPIQDTTTVTEMSSEEI